MATLIGVPTQGTPKRTVRVEDELWELFLEASKARGLSGAENIRRFIEREVEAHQQATAQPADAGG
ncbi:hypothetical protein [Actinomadura opuntiae]|uniref:hypothetical protein n=1 Tax=Actinomadura sp. OS1-43 TaxID=604315 RepID=UPI00255ADB97|nr:hypothetical protein [Actinomadura sp. OS1-43]MDL4812785.1 hypothetical protein [Actinomadura sp. OS1-43]